MLEPHVEMAEIERVQSDADCLFNQAQVEAAVEAMAAGIHDQLAGHNPLILSVLIGGLIPTAWLLANLDFPLQLDYIHATRYRKRTRGGKLHWLKAPGDMTGRHVLIVDDILDKGHTLAAIVKACSEAGAAEVFTAVLVDKQVKRDTGLRRADFVGLEVPDRYVFGCGMDYKSYLRNVTGIYAVRDS